MSLGHRVPGVTPRAAIAWWSDFQEGRHDHPFLPATRRRILARGSASVTMEEVTRVLGVQIFRESVTARIGEQEVRFAGQNDLARFDGAYAFHEEGDGTRILLDAEIQLKPALRWADVAARPLVLTILKVDLSGHARHMRRELTGGGTRQG